MVGSKPKSEALGELSLITFMTDPLKVWVLDVFTFEVLIIQLYEDPGMFENHSDNSQMFQPFAVQKHQKKQTLTMLIL